MHSVNSMHSVIKRAGIAATARMIDLLEGLGFGGEAVNRTALYIQSHPELAGVKDWNEFLQNPANVEFYSKMAEDYPDLV